MVDQENAKKLTEAGWTKLMQQAEANPDILEDGAFVRAGMSDLEGTELRFYASSYNKPNGWQYAFAEPIPPTGRLVALVGRASHSTATGLVTFTVQIDAAAQSLIADYEGGAGDFDDATFPEEVEDAMRGTPADLKWLEDEFERLTMAAGVK